MLTAHHLLLHWFFLCSLEMSRRVLVSWSYFRFSSRFTRNIWRVEIAFKSVPYIPQVPSVAPSHLSLSPSEPQNLILQLTLNILITKSNGPFVDLIFVDLSAAFDPQSIFLPWLPCHSSLRIISWILSGLLYQFLPLSPPWNVNDPFSSFLCMCSLDISPSAVTFIYRLRFHDL